MRYRETPFQKPGVTWMAAAGLCVTFAFAPAPPCQAVALAPGASGTSVTDPAGASQSQRCNPAPEATTEDMRLAMSILQDTTQIGHWRSVAWYLGELGFPECFEPLRNFVWAPHAHSDSLGYMLGAITSAQAGIGHLGSSNAQALDYLVRSTNPSFWKSLPWSDPRRTAPEIWLEMSKASIMGLGLSGMPEARQMLARLRQWPYAEAQRAAIEDAIRKFRHVSFLRKYSPRDLRPLSRLHVQELLPATTDSSLLFGAWRWMRTGRGQTYHAPPACGWSRTLVLRRDSTYSLWEADSASVYRICGGGLALRASSKGLRIEFEGWSWYGPATFWLKTMSPDLLALHPGGANGVWHSMGATLTFARESATVTLPDTINAKAWPPPRVRQSSLTSYSIEVPQPFRAVSARVQSRRWNLERHSIVPEDYEYTHYQIPSGVIGDFDGDSLADVAIYGYDENYRNVITCLLSNRGFPRASVAWSERWSGTKDRLTTRPSHYLKLFPSGKSFLDSGGNPMVLATDAIDLTSRDGEKSILRYADGIFQQETVSSSDRDD